MVVGGASDGGGGVCKVIFVSNQTTFKVDLRPNQNWVISTFCYPVGKRAVKYCLVTGTWLESSFLLGSMNVHT